MNFWEFSDKHPALTVFALIMLVGEIGTFVFMTVSVIADRFASDEPEIVILDPNEDTSNNAETN